jgi:hypothetical protein
VLPQFFPAHWLDETPNIIFSEFPSRIRIGYVQRREGGYAYLMEAEFAESGLTRAELHVQAIRNLRELPIPNFHVGKHPGGSEAWLADTHDNFVAARILLPDVHEAIATELGDEYFVAIPCRNWFFCWSKNQPAARQAHNAREALDIFLKDDYNLTPDVLLRSGEQFRLYQEQAV